MLWYAIKLNCPNKSSGESYLVKILEYNDVGHDDTFTIRILCKMYGIKLSNKEKGKAIRIYRLNKINANKIVLNLVSQFDNLNKKDKSKFKLFIKTKGN